MRIPDEILSEIEYKASVVDLMEKRYGKVVKNNSTECDFHLDKTPSLMVFDNGKRYKCHACGAGKHGQELHLPSGETIIDGGNSAIGYVMNKEQVTFKEATEIVADFIGVNLPKFKPNPEALKMRSELTQRNRQFYLELKKDKSAMDYLKSRGLDEEDVTKWRLGMIPWNWSDKKYAGRIVFALLDMYGKEDNLDTVGYGYRARTYKDYFDQGWSKDTIDKFQLTRYDDNGVPIELVPKYRNDSNNIVYNKSKYLYGYNYAWAYLKTLPKSHRFLVLVEGYLDVIMLHKKGIESAIAPCGTALTDEQADVIARTANKIYVWFDGDRAGQAASKATLHKLTERGCEVLFISSPDSDPAEVSLSVDDISEYIMENSENGNMSILKSIFDVYDKQMSSIRVKSIREALPVIESIKDEAEKQHYKAMVSSRLSINL